MSLPLFKKLALYRQAFVKKRFTKTEFHENPRNGLAAGARSDGRVPHTKNYS
jgi:hypothetical protein